MVVKKNYFDVYVRAKIAEDVDLEHSYCIVAKSELDAAETARQLCADHFNCDIELIKAIVGKSHTYYEVS